MTFGDEAKSGRDASGWETCLESLESRLAGRQPTPFSWDRFSAMFDKYAKQFGPAASAKREPDA